jgi:hypothetical protein
MAHGLTFRLELEDGTRRPAPRSEAPQAVVGAGDTIPMGRKTLRVVAVRDDADQPPALVVEVESTLTQGAPPSRTAGLPGLHAKGARPLFVRLDTIDREQ